jgi:hypothetical protein
MYDGRFLGADGKRACGQIPFQVVGVMADTGRSGTGDLVDDASGGAETEDDMELHDDGVLGVAGGVSYHGDVETVENVEVQPGGVWWWWWLCGSRRRALLEVEQSCDDAVEIVADVGGKVGPPRKSRLTHGFEGAKDRLINGKLPIEERTDLALDLVHLVKVEHALSRDRPRLVAVCVAADDFEGKRCMTN